MPFETLLLTRVAVADVQLQSILASLEDSEELQKLVRTVVHRWEPVMAVKRELHYLAKDLEWLRKTDPDSPAPRELSLLQRETLYNAFFRKLRAPWDSNRCRSQVAEAQNPWVKHSLLHSSNVLHLLQSMNIVMNKGDWSSWKVLFAMMKRFPSELYRWLFQVPRRSHYVDYEDTGFDLLNIVRMYFLQLVRPQRGHTLLEICKTQNDLGARFWSRFQEERARLDERRSRFAEAAGLPPPSYSEFRSVSEVGWDEAENTQSLLDESHSTSDWTLIQVGHPSPSCFAANALFRAPTSLDLNLIN